MYDCGCILIPILSIFKLKILCASITSNNLFKSVSGVLRNGPPDAVIKIFWIFLFKLLLILIFNWFKDDQIEKCSESTGMILVLCLIDFFLII